MKGSASIPSITAPKHYYSLWKKLLRYNMDWHLIHDLMAVRIVVDSVERMLRSFGSYPQTLETAARKDQRLHSFAETKRLSKVFTPRYSAWIKRSRNSKYARMICTMRLIRHRCPLGVGNGRQAKAAQRNAPQKFSWLKQLQGIGKKIQ